MLRVTTFQFFPAPETPSTFIEVETDSWIAAIMPEGATDDDIEDFISRLHAEEKKMSTNGKFGGFLRWSTRYLKMNGAKL